MPDFIKAVGEIMTVEVHTLTTEKMVSEAAKTMSEHRITAIPVLKDDKLVGIITETDIIKRVVVRGLDPATTKIGDVMSSNVITAPSETTVPAAAKLMEEKRIKKLPIVDDGRLKGIVTNTDLVKSMRYTLIEMKAAEPDLLESPSEYDLKPGLTYLVEEPKPYESFKMFVDKVKHGMVGLCITRSKPEWVRQMYGLEKTNILWLTELKLPRGSVYPMLGDGDLQSMYLEEMYIVVKKFLSAGGSVILIDGLNYLITVNDFKRTLHLIDYIGDEVAKSDSILIVSSNPQTLSRQELALLEDEVDATLKPGEDRP